MIVPTQPTVGKCDQVEFTCAMHAKDQVFEDLSALKIEHAVWTLATEA